VGNPPNMGLFAARNDGWFETSVSVVDLDPVEVG
jgi:hypothetical protein